MGAEEPLAVTLPWVLAPTPPGRLCCCLLRALPSFQGAPSGAQALAALCLVGPFPARGATRLDLHVTSDTGCDTALNPDTRDVCWVWAVVREEFSHLQVEMSRRCPSCLGHWHGEHGAAASVPQPEGRDHTPDTMELRGDPAWGPAPSRLPVTALRPGLQGLRPPMLRTTRVWCQPHEDPTVTTLC